jgi:hypothetical protein
MVQPPETPCGSLPPRIHFFQATTTLDSAIKKKHTRKPFGIALLNLHFRENQGEGGVLLLTRNPMKDFCPEEHCDEGPLFTLCEEFLPGPSNPIRDRPFHSLEEKQPPNQNERDRSGRSEQ